ncbi:Rieske 2Fe-2S domain-containing protein [Humibacter sp.]|uniref:Rieske 2Fe-2S domain-containing protein n=1 Tax=Humibacter sp. TaxID=1940291 RepID=UPI003F7E4419
MGRLNRTAHRLTSAIEEASALDAVADPLSGLVLKVTKRKAIKNLLSGTWLGHTLHPMLTDVPIGFWSAAMLLDVTAGERGARAARRMVGLGVLGAIPTAIAGASDWADTHGPTKRVGLVHALLNDVALTLQIVSWLSRRGGNRGRGIGLSLAASGLMVVSAYLGGHLSLVRGVGINHTAFQGPAFREAAAKWTDVAAETDVTEGKPLRVTADGVPVMLVKQDGVVRALSATCTHAGGPLDEGTLVDGCVQCPWHGSEFRLDDGTVERGPASVPEPVWEVRVAGGRVSVRSRATA